MGDARKISLNITEQGDEDMQWICRRYGLSQTEAIMAALAKLRQFEELRIALKDMHIAGMDEKGEVRRIVFPPVY